MLNVPDLRLTRNVWNDAVWFCRNNILNMTSRIEVTLWQKFENRSCSASYSESMMIMKDNNTKQSIAKLFVDKFQLFYERKRHQRRTSRPCATKRFAMSYIPAQAKHSTLPSCSSDTFTVVISYWQKIFGTRLTSLLWVFLGALTFISTQETLLCLY